MSPKKHQSHNVDHQSSLEANRVLVAEVHKGSSSHSQEAQIFENEWVDEMNSTPILMLAKSKQAALA